MRRNIVWGFHLSSGKKSKYYIDIKKASTDPKILEEVADEMAHIIENDDIDVDRIAGVVLGWYPWPSHFHFVQGYHSSSSAKSRRTTEPAS